MRVDVLPYKYVKITNIPTGDCFTYNSYTYMRVCGYGIVTDDNDIRAVELSTGEISSFGRNVAVHPVDCIVTNFTEEKKHET